MFSILMLASLRLLARGYRHPQGPSKHTQETTTESFIKQCKHLPVPILCMKTYSNQYTGAIFYSSVPKITRSVPIEPDFLGINSKLRQVPWVQEQTQGNGWWQINRFYKALLALHTVTGISTSEMLYNILCTYLCGQALQRTGLFQVQSLFKFTTQRQRNWVHPKINPLQDCSVCTHLT